MFNFARKNVSQKNEVPTYKILIVDDEESVHQITKISISSMNFKSFKIKFLHAYSGKEAKKIMQEHDDIAMALVDVIMETPNAGLDLVEYIRNDLQNSLIRLVVRTGQANEHVEMDVVEQYDIDDYKEKTELTVHKLYTTIRTSIRSYIKLIELEQKYEDTYQQLTTNHLTKLPNRIKLHQDLMQESQKVLVLIDIIAFSAINDTNGFETGDTILKELGAFLNTMYGEVYKVYHLHTDLFALLIPTNIPNEIEEIVTKVKHDISQLQIITNNFNRTIETTIGVAYQGDSNIMQRAELALNEAKHSGKNQITYYRDDLNIIKRIKNTQYWGEILKNAFAEGNILAYYQPIVNIKDNTIAKYEMLVRLRYNNEIYTPFHFLEAAKNSGQFFDIFKYMFTTACQQVKDSNVHLSVNIGNIEISHPDFSQFIYSTLDTMQIDPSYIALEILEYNSISESDYIKEKILELHNLGFEITIDDFGTKCSNFAQIENLPVTIIKIDGQYIKNLDSSQNSKIIAATIKEFAHQKDIKVVAEFVHSKEVLEIVKELGIDYAQGFYLYEPEAEIVKAIN